MTRQLASSVFLDSNNAPCANIVLRDITARKRSEARTALLNAELEQRMGSADPGITSTASRPA